MSYPLFIENSFCVWPNKARVSVWKPTTSSDQLTWYLGKNFRTALSHIMHSVLEKRKQWQKQYISIGKTDLFYNSMGLCGNFTFNFSDHLLLMIFASLSETSWSVCSSTLRSLTDNMLSFSYRCLDANVSLDIAEAAGTTICVGGLS